MTTLEEHGYMNKIGKEVTVCFLDSTKSFLKLKQYK